MCCNSLNLKRSLELRVIERHGYSVRFIEYWLYYACAGTVLGMIAFTLTRNSSRTVLESIALPFWKGMNRSHYYWELFWEGWNSSESVV